MKNIFGAAVLLPLVTSLVAIIISIVSYYWIGKPLVINRNPNSQYENINKSCETVFSVEEQTSKINYTTCFELDQLILGEDSK